VEPAWALGFTGKGVTTGIMDDGIDYMHPDLEDNFVRKVSAVFIVQIDTFLAIIALLMLINLLN